ncbi:hypothetical protein [Nakamurella sp.]|uniref:hypothetical protein n=1 Tax=Nakamurella sp. TaxID=1869182 RepID=UPI003B3B2230
MTVMDAAPEGKSIRSMFGGRTAAPAGPPRRLSESDLWDRQRQFYERDAAALWGTATVPHGITGNPRIAATYARVTLEFLRRVPGADGGTPDPVLIEFGGGSGRFAYLLLQALRDLAPDLRATYVLTDFSAQRVAGWAAHPAFRPFVDEGRLDFAVVDADRPGPLELAVSGRTLGPGELTGPVVGIANYVFDTLRQDSYAVRGGQLLEGRVTDPGDPLRPDAGGIGELAWVTAPCADVPADLAGILHHYRDTLDDTTVLVPTGGLRCLELVTGLTTGPTCMLVADKGHRTPVELCSQPEPALVPHGSGFSLMVNFDLLARYVRARGGWAVLPAQPARSLVVGVFAHPGPAGLGNPDGFAAAVQDQLLDTGPDNYFTLRPLLGAATTLEAMLAGLRLSRFEPGLFIELLPRLLAELPGAAEPVRAEVAQVLNRVWRCWFPIGEPVDLALCLGLAFSAMDRFPQAVEYLELSTKEHPDSAPAAFAMAVARRGLHDLRAADEWARRALAVEPGFSQARALRAMLAAELAED